MALVRCKHCKERIDRAAATCPHCGERVPRIWEMPLIALAVIAVVGGAGWYLSRTSLKKPPPPLPPSLEKIVANEAEAEQLSEDLVRVCALRKGARNPESFKLVKVVREPDGKLCVHFTVNNAMGSAVGERWTVPPLDEGEARKTTTCDSLPGRDRTALLTRGLPHCPTN
jgi:hypothetical protein